MSVAARVAEEMGVKLGNEVCLLIRLQLSTYVYVLCSQHNDYMYVIVLHIIM